MSELFKMWSLLRQYIWIADILGVILSAYFVANLTGLYLEGKLQVPRSVAVVKETPAEEAGTPQKPREDYNIIVERNIFDSTATPEAEATAEGEAGTTEEVMSGAAVKTSLGIKVLGVLVIGDGLDSRSTATIDSGKGDTNVCAVGDINVFAPDTKLTKVAPDRIEFIHTGRLEYAEVGTELGESIFGKPKEAVVAEATPEKGETLVKAEAPGKFVIDQREVEGALSNLDQLYTQIRAVPNFSGGKVSGMKILSVNTGSIFAKLGLQRGDVLNRINGMELDVKKGFEIFSQLKDQKTFTVDLTRRGQPLTLEYDVR